MSKENRQVPGFESLYDVGDENFSLSKSLEVGPIDLVVSSSSFFSGGLHAQKKTGLIAGYTATTTPLI